MKCFTLFLWLSVEVAIPFIFRWFKLEPKLSFYCRMKRMVVMWGSKCVYRSKLNCPQESFFFFFYSRLTEARKVSKDGTFTQKWYDNTISFTGMLELFKPLLIHLLIFNRFVGNLLGLSAQTCCLLIVLLKIIWFSASLPPLEQKQ